MSSVNEGTHIQKLIRKVELEDEIERKAGGGALELSLTITFMNNICFSYCTIKFIIIVRT